MLKPTNHQNIFKKLESSTRRVPNVIKRHADIGMPHDSTTTEIQAIMAIRGEEVPIGKKPPQSPRFHKESSIQFTRMNYMKLIHDRSMTFTISLQFPIIFLTNPGIRG